MQPLLFASSADRRPVEVIDDPAVLVERGFTPAEISAMIWLRERYQTGGSDRAVIINYLEFLRFLIKRGQLEP